eukprot:4626510-Prymnesium_polylepis.1
MVSASGAVVRSIVSGDDRGDIDVDAVFVRASSSKSTSCKSVASSARGGVSANPTCTLGCTRGGGAPSACWPGLYLRLSNAARATLAARAASVAEPGIDVLVAVCTG